LPVVLSDQDCQALARAGEGQIDLRGQEVRFAQPDGTLAAIPFEIDAEIRRRLLEGLDDVGVTLAAQAEIAAFERERERPGPVTTGL
jgi:3-isopropylmalate/(R)-2-methylmalate dehydratase small subunit